MIHQRNKRILRRSSTCRSNDRRGVEILELAFALPVMTVIIFGTLELSEVLYLKQSLAVASYEAGRLAARPGADAATVENRFQAIMTARRVDNAVIAITPANLANAAVGDTIRIDVSAPLEGNNTTNLVISSVPDLTEVIVILRE